MPRSGSRSSISVTAAVALLALSTSLAGCIIAPTGRGTVAGYSVVGQDLSASQQIRDAAIKTDVQNSWAAFSGDLSHRLDATVYDGGVLVTGQVPNEDWHAEAVRRAWQVKAVKQVYDNVTVGPQIHFMDATRDTVITTRLRSDLTFDTSIRSLNYVVKTEDGVVYLLGTARSKGELERATNHARNIPNVRRVISYVRVWDDRPQDLPPSGAQPVATPPDQPDNYAPPPSYPPPPPRPPAGSPNYPPSNYPPPSNYQAPPASEAPSSPPPPSSGTIQSEPLN